MARSAMFDTGPLSCLGRFQAGRRMKALNVSPRAGHQMGHGEKRAFLHAQTAKDHGKISLKCILRGARTAKGPLSDKIFAKCIPQNCFHCFSPLKTCIRSLCCQQHAVRACISATYCHEEAFLPSGPPLGIHDNRFLPLFNAQPFHAGRSGGRPASGQRRMREGRPASGQRRIRESACKRPAQDKESAWRGGPTPDEGGRLARSPR